MLSGKDFDFHCHSNLVRAVLPYGLTEFDVHDVLNIFQVTGLNEDDRYFMKASPARPGDFLEFFAEQDLLCALSACPAGDLSVPLWGPDAGDPLDVCRPLAVEVYKPADYLIRDGRRRRSRRMPAITGSACRHGPPGAHHDARRPRSAWRATAIRA